ncbi:antitoxin Xre/MbcA/ParS toxin-binding domain-containing protein [Pseudomonas [fluorescens] ATCC 17400]
MGPNHGSIESPETIDPQLLDAALRLFGDKAKATSWLCTPLRALGQKSPKDVPIAEALTLIACLEHGFGA